MTDSSRSNVLAKRPRPTPGCLLDADTHRGLVEDFRRAAGITRTILDPWEFAELAGLEPLCVHDVRLLFEDEGWDDKRFGWLWHRNLRERGINCFAGEGRLICANSGLVCSWHDVWRVTLELAVPRETRESGFERLCRSQVFCPENVIEDVLRGRW